MDKRSGGVGGRAIGAGSTRFNLTGTGRRPLVGVLEFISSVIGSLSWPVAVVALVFTMRRPLGRILSARPIKTLKAGPTGVELARRHITLRCDP